MDIERVNIVFNYDMPEDSDTYLHRVQTLSLEALLVPWGLWICNGLILFQVARAGRFGTKGLAVTFVSDEADAKILNDVQDRFEVNVAELPEEIDISTYSKSLRISACVVVCCDPCVLCRCVTFLSALLSRAVEQSRWRSWSSSEAPAVGSRPLILKPFYLKPTLVFHLSLDWPMIMSVIFVLTYVLGFNEIKSFYTTTWLGHVFSIYSSVVAIGFPQGSMLYCIIKMILLKLLDWLVKFKRSVTVWLCLSELVNLCIPICNLLGVLWKACTISDRVLASSSFWDFLPLEFKSEASLNILEVALKCALSSNLFSVGSEQQ